MDNLLPILIFLALWMVLQTWVLPRLGVAT
jgi:hypothetical protein